MNKRRRIYKKRSLKRSKPEKDKLYKQVQKEASKANKRLKSLSRHVKTGTWATKTLKNRLTSETLKVWSNNRIKLKANMTVTQLKAIQKAINQFLRSKTSTYKGIKDISKRAKESLYETYDLESSNLTKDDFSDIYDLFGEREFKDLAEYIDASDIIALLTDVKDYDLSEDDFLDRLNTLKDINDLDLRDKAIKLYNKLTR